MNRRDWMKTAGGLVVGFTFSGLAAFGEQVAPASPLSSDGRPLDPREVDSFLAINADGSVTVYTSKVDVGTGMRVAIAQMAAEELGVDTARVTVVDGDTARCPNTGGTGGSTGLTRGGTAVRQAAATARHALLGLGAARLKRPVADLTIVAGEVRPVAGGRGVGIGTLVGGRRLALPVDAKATLVQPARYTSVGQSPLRPDVPAKCTGRYQVHSGLHRAGHGPCACDPASGHRRHTRLGRRQLGRASSRRPRRAARELSRRRLERRMGCGPGCARAEGGVERVARAAGPRPPRALPARRRRRSRPGDCEPRAIRADRRERSVGCGARGGTRFVFNQAGRELLLAVSEPCLAGALLRRRGCPWRCGDDLDLVAGDLWPARHARARVRTRAREDAGGLRGGLGVVPVRTAPITRRPMRCCSRRRSDSPCACSGHVRTSTLGIRRARSSCSIYEQGSTRLDGWWRGTPRCGFPPTAAGRGSCSPPSQQASPRTTAGTPPRSSRTAIRRTPPITCGCWRTGCATPRSIPPTCALPASRPMSSRSRVSPTRSRPRCESIRWRSGRLA